MIYHRSLTKALSFYIFKKVQSIDIENYIPRGKSNIIIRENIVLISDFFFVMKILEIETYFIVNKNMW